MLHDMKGKRAAGASGADGLLVNTPLISFPENAGAINGALPMSIGTGRGGLGVGPQLALDCDSKPHDSLRSAACLPGSAEPLVERDSAWSLLILSDIRFMREGLADVLRRKEHAFRTVSVAADLGEAITLVHKGSHDLILIDAALPDGLAAAGRLHRLAPEIRIIALAVAETEAEVIAWAEAGASGYVPRSAALTDLVGFLTSIMQGEQACSTRVAAGLLRWIAAGSRAPAANTRACPPLTTREQEIVSLIGAGLSNKEIARRLKIGLATTKSHVHNVLGKLELQRRGQVSCWLRDHQRA